MIIGGIHVNTDFYNTPELAASTIEFFLPKDGGVPRKSAFLNRSLPANLFPRYVNSNRWRKLFDLPFVSHQSIPVAKRKGLHGGQQPVHYLRYTDWERAYPP